MTISEYKAERVMHKARARVGRFRAYFFVRQVVELHLSESSDVFGKPYIEPSTDIDTPFGISPFVQTTTDEQVWIEPAFLFQNVSIRKAVFYVYSPLEEKFAVCTVTSFGVAGR